MKRKKKQLLRADQIAFWIFVFAVAICAVWIVFGEPYLAEAREEPEPVVAELPSAEKLFDVPLDAPLQQYIKDTCEVYGNVEPSLVVAVIGVESNFDTHVINEETGCYGLMQIQLESHCDDRMPKLGVTDLLDPYENILTGIDFLSHLQNQSDDINWILDAYGGTMAHANQCKALGIQSEYAEKVLTYQQILERETL